MIALDPGIVQMTDTYEEDEWSPDVREIVIRRDERSQSRPREMQYFSGSGFEHNSLTSRVVYRKRPTVDAAGQSQALVLRPGASGLPTTTSENVCSTVVYVTRRLSWIL